MIPTRAVMELINKANSALIEAKYALIEAERITSSSEEKAYIGAVRESVQEGIKEILHNFFPETEFDEQAWLKRRTSKDIEHDQRVQKILDDSAQRQSLTFDAIVKQKEENETCSHDCKDCDSREVAGDEEHCLQGEEMK
jgi:hypothetical protein